ncbi:hypothetical protein ACFRR7_17650 [Streptomyces sp. NPDC056909]|uniref:hypothetical protein n=1 Tax=Streptomyces sp. NPDC056909 TaxID=3345963 RepID=UPI00369B70BC
MEIEILVVPDCPSEKLAAERLRSALNDVGLHGTTFTTRTIGDAEEAERIGFTGSPTILIDGQDPFAEPGRTAGLSCRIYRTPDGLAGVPGHDQLRQALTTVAEPPTPPSL